MNFDAPKNSSSLDQRFSLYLIFSCFVAALSMFTTNYNFNVMNIPSKFVHCDTSVYSGYFSSCIEMSDDFFNFVNSIISIGGCLGCFLSIYLGYRIGRKSTLIVNNIGFIIGGFMLSFTNNKIVFIIGRFIIGISGGIAQSVAPLYVCEIATVKLRGALGLTVAIIGDLGGVFAVLFSLGFNGYYVWRVLVGFIVFPAIIQMISTTIFLVETPRFSFLFRDNTTKGTNDLKRLRKNWNIENEKNEILTNKSDIDLLKVEHNQLKAISLLISEKYRKRFLIVLVVLFGQGMSGIAIMDYYSNEIIAKVYQDIAPILTTICVTLGVLVSIIVMFFIDRAGRRVFLMASHLGIAISCALLTIGLVHNIDNLAVASVFLFRMTYGLGLAGIPFIIASEFFPTYLVSGGNGIVMASCWISHFAVGSLFETLDKALGNYMFLVFVATNTVLLVVVFLLLPETKNTSLEQIDQLFNRSNSENGKSKEIEATQNTSP